MSSERVKQLQCNLSTFNSLHKVFLPVKLYRPTFDEVMRTKNEKFLTWMKTESPPHKQPYKHSTPDASVQTRRRSPFRDSLQTPLQHTLEPVAPSFLETDFEQLANATLGDCQLDGLATDPTHTLEPLPNSPIHSQNTDTTESSYHLSLIGPSPIVSRSRSYNGQESPFTIHQYSREHLSPAPKRKKKRVKRRSKKVSANK